MDSRIGDNCTLLDSMYSGSVKRVLLVSPLAFCEISKLEIYEHKLSESAVAYFYLHQKWKYMKELLH